jgi:mono/diheme cytochrome c family protein
MRSRIIAAATLFVISVCPLTVSAQQDTATLTPVELGKALFKQRCGVCHIPLVVGKDKGQTIVLSTATFGPTLTKQLVAPAEEAMRQQIMQGSARMPGFQYTLKPQEITAILEYLKTVEKSSQRGASDATNDLD